MFRFTTLSLSLWCRVSGAMWTTVIILQIVTHLAASGVDYYETLGVDRNANEQAIRRAFKKLALVMHPDKRREDPEAHRKFIEISEAYDVLKDPRRRKFYDEYGVDGGKSFDNQFWGQNSFPFNFAMFQYDPKITVLTDSNFDALVVERGTRWFIYFFSPLCVHCHAHGRLWLTIANEFDGALRVAVVNCYEDNFLCNRISITRYPMFKMYPENKYFAGEPSFRDLADFANEFLVQDVITLTYEKLIHGAYVSHFKGRRRGALVSFCQFIHRCLDMSSLQKLSYLLQPMAFVAQADCDEDKALCNHLNFSSGMVFYRNGLSELQAAVSISNTRNPVKIADEVVRMVTSKFEISEQDLLLHVERKPVKKPVVILLENEAEEADENIRMKTIMVAENIHYKWYNCRKSSGLCGKVHVQKYPKIIVCKTTGGYEVYHGKLIAESAVSFAKSALETGIINLREEDVKQLNIASETWLVVFTASWCPPCILLVPHIHETAKVLGNRLRIGLFDCATYRQRCNQFSIRQLPTLVLYNETKPYAISGYQDGATIIDFVMDIISPLFLEITERFLIHNILKSNDKIVWMVAYTWPESVDSIFMSEYRKLARLVKSLPHVKIATVNCAEYKEFCDKRNIRTYPTVHLHQPANRPEYHIFLNAHADSQTMFAWLNVATLPDVSQLLTETTFKRTITNGQTWLIYFYSSWSRECQDFEPEFKYALQELEPYNISIGKVHCSEEVLLCTKLSITNYPTLLLYPANRIEIDTDGIPAGQAIYELRGFSIVNRSVHQTAVTNESGLFTIAWSNELLKEFSE
uniref:DnaJ homolog subfamily C member 16 n=1 Tax=Trichuris muris TaxID=70415 RepID=A0A5S6QFC8_TRIMR